MDLIDCSCALIEEQQHLLILEFQRILAARCFYLRSVREMKLNQLTDAQVHTHTHTHTHINTHTDILTHAQKLTHTHTDFQLSIVSRTLVLPWIRSRLRRL